MDGVEQIEKGLDNTWVRLLHYFLGHSENSWLLAFLNFIPHSTNPTATMSDFVKHDTTVHAYLTLNLPLKKWQSYTETKSNEEDRFREKIGL